MTTEKQVQANQANAQRSTGPRTPEGKALASLNALTHGILAKKVVIRGERIREDPKEFQAILEQFWRDLAPVGAVEELLVERIVSCSWRLRRVLIAEAGAIRLGVDTGAWQRLVARREAVAKMKQNTLLYTESAFKKSALGVQHLRENLQNLRACIEQQGELKDWIVERTAEVFGEADEEQGGLTYVLSLYYQALKDNPEGLAPDVLKAQHKQQVLGYLDDQAQHLQALQRVLEEQEARENAAQIAVSQVPSKDKLDSLLRYETSLERQLYRALNQLERRQRLRKGEVVPPPLSVEVSTAA